MSDSDKAILEDAERLREEFRQLKQQRIELADELEAAGLAKYFDPDWYDVACQMIAQLVEAVEGDSQMDDTIYTGN